MNFIESLLQRVKISPKALFIHNPLKGVKNVNLKTPKHQIINVYKQNIKLKTTFFKQPLKVHIIINMIMRIHGTIYYFWLF